MAHTVRNRASLILLLLAAASGLTSARAEPLPADFMTSDQVKPGMKGIGKTAFSGFEVGTFDVEILGVQHRRYPATNVILARLSGPMLEQHGVVQGMSGSPVYIDGKLIGAVAWGWSFSYYPFCGLTPIERMWDVWQEFERPAPATNSFSLGSSDASTERAWDWEAAWKTYQDASEPNEGEPLIGGEFRPDHPAFEGIEGRMRPLTSLVCSADCSPRVLRRLRAFFSGMGMDVVEAGALAGGGSGNFEGDFPPLQAGSALGIPFVNGDFLLGGVGTVTHTDGDRFIAFGHSMFSMGPTNAPIAPAYTFAFLQNYAMSSKMSEVGPVIGALGQDRMFAVAGRVGDPSPRFPIRFRVRGPGAFNARKFDFTCWENEDILPVLTVMAIEQSYVTASAIRAELTAESKYEIRLADGRVIKKEFVSSTDNFAIGQATSEMMFDLFILTNNPFKTADIESIEMDVYLRPGMAYDTLLWLKSQYDTYESGETVRLTARLQPFKGEPYDRAFELMLPESLRSGAYVVHLTDSSGAVRIESLSRPGLFAPRNYEDVVRLINLVHQPEDQLRMYLFEPKLGLELKDASMNNLPGSLRSVIQASTPPGLQYQSIGALIVKQDYKSPGPVFGSQMQVIRVVDHIDR